ncbi:hypothetical protein [Streptomyces sp. NBC_00268]|uniref:hypothetical protein n=1 Tax=Streptomyces sp. NBC_00268 TaxID=2975695 RepID=UPI00225ADEEB|nr:hypothetical protein [Streptomyces sp. NBC_00268]MCX5190989.1 hypothetical protein [Streptomyces sp. NBC_00268]
MWGQQIDGQHSPLRSTKVTVDWCGIWNNGGRCGGVHCMSLALNEAVESLLYKPIWIRVDAYRNGKVVPRSGSNRQGHHPPRSGPHEGKARALA